MRIYFDGSLGVVWTAGEHHVWQKFSVDAGEALKTLSAKGAVHKVQEIGLTKVSALFGHLSKKHVAKDLMA